MAFIIFDVTERSTFEKARKWVTDLDEIENDAGKPIIRFLVGNKIDLVNE